MKKITILTVIVLAIYLNNASWIRGIPDDRLGWLCA